MKVLCICGSPRLDGNASYLLERVSEHLQDKKVETEIIKLADFSLERCTGCLVCEETNCTGNCTLKDDMSEIIYEKILKSDSLIFGSPSYFDMPTGLMKSFIDRTNAILTKLIEKEYTYGIVVVGQSEIGSLESTCASIRKYCAICEMKEISPPLQVIAREVGDAQKNKNVAALISTFADTFVENL